MRKEIFVLLLMVLLLHSCRYFENKSKKSPVQEVDTIVDFSKVDAFPLFPDCKDIPSREKQQICFQVEMAEHIYAFLKAYQFNAKEMVNDTALVKLRVDANGKTSVSTIQISAKTKKLLPDFDSIVKVCMQQLPILEPAIKRDMPVTTEFTLPIILKDEL